MIDPIALSLSIAASVFALLAYLTARRSRLRIAAFVVQIQAIADRQIALLDQFERDHPDVELR